jgi:AhpD family alkylhydroperoxidase
MTRLAEIQAEDLDGEMREYFENADARGRMLLTPTAHAPELMMALHRFGDELRELGTLSGRLVELLRLRVAFHNQCVTCMAMRYQSGLDDGVTEALVCSLEKPYDAPDLTEAEKAALAYADISATNHLAITDGTFEELRKHFTEAEIVELGLHIAYFVGYGRLTAAWDLVEELPDSWRNRDGVLTPWSGEGFVPALP